MTVEMEDVLAWIDNELEEPRAGQVKKAVMSDKNLQQIADRIRASQLPYSDAYEQERFRHCKPRKLKTRKVRPQKLKPWKFQTDQLMQQTTAHLK